jgi:hypothetical protein
MDEYGEDAKILEYPDGRLFGIGNMGSMEKQFETAFKNLKEN